MHEYQFNLVQSTVHKGLSMSFFSLQIDVNNFSLFSMQSAI